MKSASNHSAQITAICPACGMLCDDINLDSLDQAACAKSKAFFLQKITAAEPMIAGKASSLAQAVAKTAELLKTAKQPLIGGLSTDLTGFRAAYQLAAKCHAGLAHMHAATTWRNIKVLQTTGWQTTTLTEVRNRADVIVCVGTDIVKHHPRFFERIIWPKQALFVKNEARQVIYLGGKDLNSAPGTSPQGKRPTVLPCDPAHLPEVAVALHALVAGKTLHTDAVAGIPLADLTKVAQQLQQASYATLIWVAKDLDFPHAELTIQQIAQTVVELTKSTRAGALALGDSDGGTSVNHAHTWLSGLAIQPEALSEHDALIWVNSYSPGKAMPKTDAPTVVIGNSNLRFSAQPDVFIPVATPGLDCSGHMMRVDSNVILPLKRVKQSRLPTLAAVLAMIEAAL